MKEKYFLCLLGWPFFGSTVTMLFYLVSWEHRLPEPTQSSNFQCLSAPLAFAFAGRQAMRRARPNHKTSSLLRRRGALQMPTPASTSASRYAPLQRGVEPSKLREFHLL